MDNSHSNHMDKSQDVDSAHLDKTGAERDPIHVYVIIKPKFKASDTVGHVTC